MTQKELIKQTDLPYSFFGRKLGIKESTIRRHLNINDDFNLSDEYSEALDQIIKVYLDANSQSELYRMK